MNKLTTTASLGLAGMVATGLIAWQAPVAFADHGSDDSSGPHHSKAFKRDDDSHAVVTTVDDDDDNLQVLSAVLSDRQAYVETANSAQATYELLDRFNPDVLVLDLEMPEEDGFSLIAQIREREEALGTKKPAIALTGHVRVEDRVRALSAGFDMFVPKPVEADELVATIISLVSSK